MVWFSILVCVFWSVVVVNMWRVHLSVPQLHAYQPQNNSDLPTLSILVPACNEENSIRESIQSLLGQEYSNLQIVVINDRSTDNTGAIVDALALEDSRIEVCHVQKLPEGWLGKVHALHCGMQKATGTWVLCTDADIIFSKDALTKAVCYAEEHELDHLCVMPKMYSSSVWASMAIVSAIRSILMAFKPWHVTDKNRPEFVGVGAFNLIRRSHFLQTEGFAWLCMDIADDLALGMLMKQSGGKPGVLLAPKDVAVEWYPSVGDVIKGLEKNAYSQIARFSLWRGILAGMMLGISSISTILIALFVPKALLFLVPVIMVFAWICGKIIEVPFLHACFSVICGDALLMWVILRSTILGHKRGGVIWRGTVYPSEKLRAGTKVWM